MLGRHVLLHRLIIQQHLLQNRALFIETNIYIRPINSDSVFVLRFNHPIIKEEYNYYDRNLHNKNHKVLLN